MSRRPPFDGNDYRKRVLAAVLKRGGPETSDPLELYDLPVDGVGRWSDGDVAAQLAEVWGFWQRQRDHPKYGTLVGLLVEAHDHHSAVLLDRRQRATLVDRVRGERQERDLARFHLLDEAVTRLVQRHGGVPRDKVDGLVEIGALGGLSADEVHARLRRHRVIDPAPVAPAPRANAAAVSDHRRQQVRDLLDEFGRLQEQPAPPTLLALLGLGPEADDAEISVRAEAWRARCRELPPLRIRAVADELMVHVADLLEAGPFVRAAYLDAVVEDVKGRLRPRLRAAVLVEDRLVADDHEHLVAEAQDLGLDPERARQAVASIAAELAVEVEPIGGGSRPGPAYRPATAPAPAPNAAPPADRAWEQALRAARAALRRGALLEARRLVVPALSSADPAALAPARAVAAEIEDAIREAELRWRAAATALAARRFAEAVDHLEHLARTAGDLPGPRGAQPADVELDRARREVAAADEQVRAAQAAPEPVAALLAVLDRWPTHPAALEALARLPLHPPGPVRAARAASGVVVVEWQPSATGGVTYRVARVQPDGTTRVVGRTGATRIEDGGAPPGMALPDYTVAAVQPGRMSEEARTGATAATPPPRSAPPPTPPPAPAAEVAAPTAVVATRDPGGSVVVRWSGPAGAEFKVSRRAVDGRWQVVGRTRHHAIEDGGAPAGDVPVYAVSARLDAGVSAEAYSAG
jgi:hypothetical protein